MEHETIFDSKYLKQYEEIQAHVLQHYGLEFANNEHYIHALLLFGILTKSGNQRIRQQLAYILFPVGIDEENIMFSLQSFVQIQTIQQMLIRNDISMGLIQNILNVWILTTFQRQQCYENIMDYIMHDKYTKVEYRNIHKQQNNHDLLKDQHYTDWVMNNQQFKQQYRLQRINAIYLDLNSFHCKS